MSELPPILTVPEVARYLRISRGSAYEAARTGQLPVVRIGRSLRVPRHLLLELLGEPATEDASQSEHADRSTQAAEATSDERENGRHGEAEDVSL